MSQLPRLCSARALVADFRARLKFRAISSESLHFDSVFKTCYLSEIIFTGNRVRAWADVSTGSYSMHHFPRGTLSCAPAHLGRTRQLNDLSVCDALWDLGRPG